MAYTNRGASGRGRAALRSEGTAVPAPDAIAALARAGRHVEAIEHATRALDIARASAEERMSYSELRLESRSALGQNDLAAADAAAMVGLADTTKSAALTARALMGRARVRIRRDNKEALALAGAAAKAAVRSKDPRIVAHSLRLLAEAQARTGDSEAALANARKAVAAFERLRDIGGSGRAHWVIGLVHLVARRGDEAREAAGAALRASREAGDAYGEGNALNLLSQVGADLAEGIRLRHEAAAAFGRAGHVEQRMMMVGNLATSYQDLGLFHRARRLQGEVAETARAIGARGLLTYALGNRLDAELRLGLTEAATTRLAEFAEQVAALGDPNMEGQLEIARGDLALEAADPATAAGRYADAAKISRRAGLGSETSCYALASRALLAAGEAKAALAASVKATALHRAQHFAPPDTSSSQEIWWRHVQALAANGQRDAASKALERSYGFLLDGIANLRDEGLRRSYLNKVAANREILAAWVADATARKLPRERAHAHLVIESNVREPFKRLADTGLRLNALRNDADIRRFIVEEATELSGGERVLLVLEHEGRRELADSLVPRGEDGTKLLRAIEPYLAQAAAARTAVLAHTPASAARVRQRSRIVAPLEAQGRLLGYLYVDMDGLYGRFDDTDRDMIGLLANQAAVALENARWSEGLERKVDERTEALAASNAALAQRAGELAIINEIQRGVAAALDFQAIVDLVGDKLREVLGTGDIGIRWRDRRTGLVHYLYEYEHGKRTSTSRRRRSARSASGWRRRARRSSTATEPKWKRTASIRPTGTDSSLSCVFVPILGGESLLGSIIVENYEREDAYSESDVRMLSTVAASMGVALENARLFDETQRLLKETEQRAAELSVINSIQQGMAEKLDFQAIVDLVGDKLREVFRIGDVGIRWHDLKTDRLHFLYEYERGVRIDVPSFPVIGQPDVGALPRNAQADGRRKSRRAGGTRHQDRPRHRDVDFEHRRSDPRRRSRTRVHHA